MALFDNNREQSESLSGDAATRALSVTVVENDFVAGVYEKLANVYDVVFGPTLHPGRLEAIRKMNIRPRDSVLEVGVGTGINLSLYPSTCAITGIDLSTPMLVKARERIIKKGLRNCRVAEMDAAAMSFPDESFDIVYAPYLISVVPDPVQVAREMRRVCRRGGRPRSRLLGEGGNAGQRDGTPQRTRAGEGDWQTIHGASGVGRAGWRDFRRARGAGRSGLIADSGYPSGRQTSGPDKLGLRLCTDVLLSCLS